MKKEIIFKDKEFDKALEDKILPWVRDCLKEGYCEVNLKTEFEDPESDIQVDSSQTRSAVKEDEVETGNIKLHYAYALNPNARGTVIISHGFCEFITKFYEMLYFFYQAGYSVFMPEHRGHGFSHREVANPDIVHIDDFHTYVSDFENFFEKVV
ncbi:MAG: alpha/beta hydrolase, partial [Bacteroidaceae bacterium]|nr:alpha/beta hydrolase [Bacteroidaceae bacterium]